jgi:hypothetical protein
MDCTKLQTAIGCKIIQWGNPRAELIALMTRKCSGQKSAQQSGICYRLLRRRAIKLALPRASKLIIAGSGTASVFVVSDAVWP